MKVRKLRDYRQLLIATTAIGWAVSAPLVATHNAAAQEVEITEAQTTPAATGTIDGGAPADILITETGAVQVTGGAAVVVNSDNKVTNDGNVSSEAESGAIGILIDTGETDPVTITGDVLSTGAITIIVPQSGDDPVSGSDNYGILVSGEGSFVGGITTSDISSILVPGDNSAAIAIRSDMVGDLSTDGTITVTGINSRGISVESGFLGDILNRGNINSAEADSIGIFLGGDVTGSFVNAGAITIGSPQRFDSNGELVLAIPGEAAVKISGDLTGGFVNDRFTEALDDGDDDPDNDIVVEFIGQLNTVASGNAILVTPDADAARNITLGTAGIDANAFAIINRGAISTAGTNIGQDATAVRIQGLTIGELTFTTMLDGGFLNSVGSTLVVTSVDAQAVAISIGADATVPIIRNDGTLSAQSLESQDDDLIADLEGGPFGGDAIGILIEEGATVDQIINTSIITSVASGTASSSYAILDLSGTVTRLINTGSIAANIENDSSGRLVAIDLSASTQSILFHNSGIIFGDVLLGSGDDEAQLAGGSITGLLDLGGGSNHIFLTGNAVFSGSIMGENINLVTSGTSRFEINEMNTANVTDATFGSGTTLSVLIDAAGGNVGNLVATGTVTFEAGSMVLPQLVSFLPQTTTVTIVQAGQVILEEGAVIDFMSPSVIFDVDFDITDTNIDLTLTRKSAQDLELLGSTGVVFDASFEALSLDDELGGIVANLESREEVEDIFDQLAPVANGATRQIAILGQGASFGAISRRTAGLRSLVDGPVSGIQSRNGFWVQEYGTLFEQQARGDDAGFDGGAFGIAGGIDTQVLGLDALGISVMQTFAEATEKDSLDEEVFVSSTTLGVYSSLSIGDFYVDAAAGYALNRYESERVIMFGEIERHSLGNWRGHTVMGNVAAGYKLTMRKFFIAPSVTASYLRLSENSYAERDGGAGVDLAFESRTQQSLVATAGATLGFRENLGENFFDFQIRGNVARELKNDAPVINASFAAAGERFTVNGPGFDKQYYQAGAGIGFSSDISTFTLDYDMERKDGFVAHVAAFTFRMRF